MLGFFRKYQKSFMLIFLAPALIAMGITGAILSVLSDPGDQVAGRVNGQTVFMKEFENVRQLYRLTNPRAEEDDAWRFLALMRAAQRAGLEVSDEEVRTGIHTDMKWSIARMRALEELDKLGIDRDNPNASRKFQELFFKFLMEQDNDSFDIERYKQALKQEKGTDHRSYEEQQRREVLVQRFLETLREMAVVDPTEVWDAYQEKHQLRVVDLLAIPAERYAPKADAKEGERGYVSDAQVLAYYNERVVDFDEPRRVNLRYAALRIADMEPQEASDDDLRSFNKRFGIAPVDSFDAFVDDVRSAYYSHEAKSRAMVAMDLLADAVEAAKDKAAKAPEANAVDLSAIVAEAKRAHSSQLEALIVGETGLGAEDQLDTAAEETLQGFAARRWFRVENTEGAVSDVLGDGSHLYVLQTREIKHARTPRFEDIKAKAREAYLNGSDAELKAFYEEHKNVKYRKGTAYKVEVATALDADYEGDHAKAETAIDDAMAAASKWKKRRFQQNWRRLEVDPDIKPRGLNVVEIEAMDVDGLAETNELANAAANVPGSQPYKLGKTELKDKSGWALYRLVRKEGVKVEEFAKIKDRVRADVRIARGLERAEENVEAELAKLAHKTGDELAKAIEAAGLEVMTSEPFTRDAVTLSQPKIPDAGTLVAEAFAEDTVVGGDYDRYVLDPDGDRLLLVRVAETRDAPKEGYQEQFVTLREELLTKRRGEFAQEQIRLLVLEAKGISTEHMAYATAMRDGPGGIKQLKLRQIYLPADPAIINGWLETAAKTLADKALAEMADGRSWEALVQAYSEDKISRRRGGELPPSGKDDLAKDFGNAFAEAAYQLTEGAQPIIVKSIQGYHLLRQTGESKGFKVLEHILITLDPAKRKLPPEVVAKAEEATKATLAKAQKALEAGQPFAKVAEEFGSADDPIGQGQEFTMDYVTAFERAALAQVLDWELPETDPQHGDLEFAPLPVEVKSPDGSTNWHLFACDREADDRKPAWDPEPRRNRRVYHIQAPSQKAAMAVRAELVDYMKEQISSEEGDRPTWTAILKKFQEVASERSTAPDKAKGGAIGLIRLDEQVRGYGDEFLAKATLAADGSPVKPGYRPSVFKGQKGYHLIEVLDVITTEAGDTERQREVADLVLNGTGWQ